MGIHFRFSGSGETLIGGSYVVNIVTVSGLPLGDEGLALRSEGCATIEALLRFKRLIFREAVPDEALLALDRAK